MNKYIKRLNAEALLPSWQRKAETLTDAASEIARLEAVIKDNAIIHVREINKLLNKQDAS